MATQHQVVSAQEWTRARKELLAREKEFTRLRDELTRQRRELPWEAITKEYIFQDRSGKRTLGDLVGGRSQLLVYHFMFGPTWDAGCPICSFWADNFNNIIVHLNQRDVTMVAVSRAPWDKLAAYQERMGWNFEWVSSGDSDFNFDLHVSFTPEELRSKSALYNYQIQDPHETEREAVSVFTRDAAGKIFHTYSAYARGIDLVNTAYNYLDLTPKGRDENGRGPFWVKRHDEYPA
jgi:predicted dithiol-disulfide oxidoreductase (DUF899 family)